MNPFLNPFFSASIIKHYLTDINRAWKLSYDNLRKYQDKALVKSLKYAYKIPAYKEKYSAAGIKISDINGIKDLQKLPLMTKAELIEGFPDKIIPPNFNKDAAYCVGTSGSSGRPVSIYKDNKYIMIEALGAIRQLKAYGLNWRKTKITNIGDFSLPSTTDEECLKKGLMKNLSPYFSLKNYQLLYTGEEPKKLLDQIEKFNPELIIGYTSVLMGLATLKNKGKGKAVRPKYIVSSGEVLDSYSREYIEEAFNSKVLNLYATTEGGSIAFECLNGNMHINSDFVHVELLDKNGKSVSENEFGSMVITRLFPGGTPIIRYTGLSDIGAFGSEDECDCGLHTPILKSLEGRKKDAIVTPKGQIFPPATIPMPLAEATGKYNTYQIKRFQIIQKKIDEIEINVEIDEDQRDKKVKVEKLLKEIERNYEKFLEENMKVTVKEVKKVELVKGSTSPPLIISKLDNKHIEKALL